MKKTALEFLSLWIFFNILCDQFWIVVIYSLVVKWDQMFGASFIQGKVCNLYLRGKKMKIQMLFHSTGHAIWKHFSFIEHLPKNSLSNLHTELTKISAHKGPPS